jgi:uracil-DNA glycosylase
MLDDVLSSRPTRTLPILHKEWSTCTKCNLGERRITVDGHFVFGEGVTRSIMLIGEGPGVDEEKLGRPFIGKSGTFLRNVLQRLGMNDYYLSNLVSCRSCQPASDAEGKPIIRTNWETKLPEQVFKDEPPNPVQYGACSPRLYEEIYLVDPIVIVGLGQRPCEALLKRSVTIKALRGEATQIEVPGRGYQAVLTEKRREWRRAVKGITVQPVERFQVLYHFIPTFHPAFITRILRDGGDNEKKLFQQFVADLRKALKTYETYLEMVFGKVPMQHEIDDDRMFNDLQRDDT